MIVIRGGIRAVSFRGAGLGPAAAFQGRAHRVVVGAADPGVVRDFGEVAQGRFARGATLTEELKSR